MKASEETGVIYSLTSKTSGKSYIGQAKDYKHKKGIPYVYGANGRWNDHVSINSETQIHQAIKKYGKEDFDVKLIIRCNIKDLDAKEAEHIKSYNTLYPKGYNIMKHSRVKGRDESNIVEFYLKDAIFLEIVPIKNNGLNSIVYIYIENEKNEKSRITFGQGKDVTFQNACKEAIEFVKPFKNKSIPISIHPDILGIKDPLASYQNKILQFEGKNINKITIGKNKSGDFYLIVLKVYEDNNFTKICFGGKTIELYDAYKTANLFIQKIKKDNTKIEKFKSIEKFLKSATGSCQLD